jgi:hypothetical protein
MQQEDEIVEYNELTNEIVPTETEEQDLSMNYFEDFDNTISDIDFSQFKGKDFKSNFAKINQHVEKKRRKKKPLSKEVGVGRGESRYGSDRATISGPKKKLARVLVPRDRKVIVEGVDKFILNGDSKDDSIRNIGYYQGKKLKKLILTFNNDSALDFVLQLFNPSMPLDYLQSTSLNLNDKIQVAGGAVSYSDVLFNLLANPTLVVNATIVVNGPSVEAQISQSLGFTNKEITGDVKVHPINLNLKIDTMQVFQNTIYFDIMKSLNRPFIPDGMDVIQYTVLKGNTVTMCFYYKQISLKRVFFKEAKESKKLL